MHGFVHFQHNWEEAEQEVNVSRFNRRDPLGRGIDAPTDDDAEDDAGYYQSVLDRDGLPVLLQVRGAAPDAANITATLIKFAFFFSEGLQL